MLDEREGIEYLARYGYLGGIQQKRATDNALADDDYRSTAIADFQEVANVPVSGVLDEATRSIMAQPRCGFPDRGLVAPDAVEDFVASGSAWPQAIITYAFDNATADLGQNDQRQIIRSAFAQWAAVVPLVFVERPANQAVDINIRFAVGAHGATPDESFDGPGTTLAHAFFPPPNAGGLAGDVHYDDAETWVSGVGGAGFDLLTVSVHEVGHSLGLRHSSVPNSTMNPFYPTPTPPAADDRAGVRNVYRRHIWAASLYRDLLARRFDDQGLDFWVRRRAGGATVQGVARAFCYSQEHSQNLTTQLYHSLLDRAPDPTGLTNWTTMLSNGTSRQTVLTGFLLSAEYQNRNPLPNAFVESLYRRLLGRAPDAAGMAGWVARLNQGAQPREVVRGFLDSQEYTENLVREHYQRYLRRAPDAAGLQDWSRRVQGGLAHQDLTVGFLASPEYEAAVEIWW